MSRFETFSWPHTSVHDKSGVHQVHHYFPTTWLEHHKKDAHPSHHFQFPSQGMERMAWGEQHPDNFVSLAPHAEMKDVHHGRHFQFPTPGMIRMAWGEQNSDDVGKWAPNTDIRDVPHAYHIEIEVPGLTDKKSVKMYWMSPTALIVEGNVARPDIGRGGGAEGDAIWKTLSESSDVAPKDADVDDKLSNSNGTEQKDASNGLTPKAQMAADVVQAVGKDQKKLDADTANAKLDATPKFLLAERQVGPWHRSFTLPPGVDMKGLRARLDGGLLRIYLPKMEAKDEDRVNIEVEGTNQPQPWLGTL